MQENIEIVDERHIWDKLAQTPCPPKVLYKRGAFGAPHHKLITIVGSRLSSEYSRQVVEEICKSLAGQPVSIVSGLARGVDTYAHTFALKYDLHTIAIVGSGLEDRVLYPRSNLKLAHKIIKSGGLLISEYESKYRSQSWMFPARNRIMAGISDLVIIIEAKEKSGTLITARLATDYNRDVMVIPNSIYSNHSKGSNELLKQGAYVYTEPKDIFNLLNLEYPEGQKISYIPSPTETLIIEAINNGHRTTQQIIENCSPKLLIPEIIQSLLNLEIEEVIKRIDGAYVVLST